MLHSAVIQAMERPEEPPKTSASQSRRYLIGGSQGIYYDLDEQAYYRQEIVKKEFQGWGNFKFDAPQEIRWHKLRAPAQTIYLVGEGDFSYARGLLAQSTDTFVKATSYDPQQRVLEYPGADAALSAIRGNLYGAVAHQVNAMDLEHTASPRQVDILQFNFPHTGTGSGTTGEQSEEFQTFLRDNTGLLREFFRSAHFKVKPTGAVRLTYKKTYPYTQWNVGQLAAEQGWVLVSEEAFQEPQGYSHVLTKDTSGEVSNTYAVTATFRKSTTWSPATAQTGVSPHALASKLEQVRREDTPPQPAKSSQKPAYYTKPWVYGTVEFFNETKEFGFINYTDPRTGNHVRIYFNKNNLSSNFIPKSKDKVKFYRETNTHSGQSYAGNVTRR